MMTWTNKINKVKNIQKKIREWVKHLDIEFSSSFSIMIIEKNKY